MVAITVFVPWAILANGPPCKIAGFPSSVCTKLGFKASLSKTAIAPTTFKSRAKTAFPSRVLPTNIFPKRNFKSCKFLERHKIAITSEAGVILKPSSRIVPLAFAPTPIMIWRNERSFISITRFQAIDFGSKFKEYFGFWRLLSITADNKLFAFSIAEKSPVKCKFISSIGTTCAYPPPAAPPFKPKTGPREGSRKAAIAFFPIKFKPSVKPIDIVVFPSPYLVGDIAETKINFPFGFSTWRFKGNYSFNQA